MDDKTVQASVILTGIRNTLTRLRNDITDLMRSHPRFADQVEYYEGYLTTGISSMCNPIERIIKTEIKNDDQEFGESYSFKSRGIGMDSCPGCFVCGGGKALMRNISGLVKSKEDGEAIVSMFAKGRLDYRDDEPEWIQVKVGSCEKHIPALIKLHHTVGTHGVIRQSMVDSIIKQYTK